MARSARPCRPATVFDFRWPLARGRAHALTGEQRGADAAVFGSLYLANPDLRQRFAEGAPLNAPDRETFYSDGPQGYVDYPVLGQTLEVGQVDLARRRRAPKLADWLVG
jgi:hypothetical protein